ncbi:hydrogenase expression/formation protein HupK [Frigidibacter sp. ROC022]|uniref:hydrogenase expression/formation protein HupK n=1 Tax=Frigidibacter sp. ROC022 TaxID=2971796 RepID=UPI00215B2C30|nr:hydrogenase expression/formation protein HupK [Frigidibacter sp. ROC022]
MEALILGKPVEEAAELLPRLFNLCRTAQKVAARMAFGLPLGPEDAGQVRLEILREHLVRFCLKLPGHFGTGAAPFPDGWQTGGAAARLALFGPRGALPETPAELDAFLDAGQGIAPVLTRVRDCFAPGEACSGHLPDVDLSNALDVAPLENSVAGRQARNPVLLAIEERFGRGPFWRVAARAYDAQDCMNGRMPRLVSPRPGVAIVPAARGTYAIAARVEAGVVTAFHRVTPTDHLLAPGGVLDRSLASLPARKAGMAALLLDILDPCSPVRLRELDHA